MRSLIQNADAYDLVARNGLRLGTQVLAITASFTIPADPPPSMIFNPGTTAGLFVQLPPLTTTTGIDGRLLLIQNSASASVSLGVQQDPTDNGGASILSLAPGQWALLLAMNSAWQQIVTPSSSGGNIALPRNVLDGGDATTNPFQRGTSFTGITNTLTYTADRWWALGGAGSSISVSQQAQTDVQGFGNSLRFGRANANADLTVIKLGQVVETADSIRFQGRTVTLSFYAKAGANFSAASSNMNVLIATGTGTNQSAATLASASWTGYSSRTLTPLQGAVAAAANIAQAITTTAVRYAFTTTIPATATQVGVVLSYTPVGTAGASDFIDVYGVQLEDGGQPSAFEHLDIQMVLEICQRYFYQLNEPAAGVSIGMMYPTGTNTQSGFIPLPVQMRTAPTVTVTVGTFKQRVDGAAASAATGLTTGAGHTVTGVTLNATATISAAVHSIGLEGGGGTGLIAASADF